MTQANLADLGHEKLAQLIQDAYNEGYLRGQGDGYHQACENVRAELEAAGFHPEHDVDDYDPTDDANSVAEAGDADWSYDDGQPNEAQEWYDYDPDC